MIWPACYNHIFSRLERVREVADARWEARCPAHDDRRPSMSLKIGQRGNLLLHCNRAGGDGCPAAAIMAAIDCTLEDLWPDNRYFTGKSGRPTGLDGRRQEAVYVYRDEGGRPLFEVVRYRMPDGSKQFRQRQQNPEAKMNGSSAQGANRWIWNLEGVRRVLYRLPELLDHLEEDPQRRVLVVEGEKVVDALWGIGVPATCNPGGAGKWELCDYSLLRDCNVAVLPDDDPWDAKLKVHIGIKHAMEVCAALYPCSRAVKWVRLFANEKGEDAYDWLAAQASHVAEKRRLLWSVINSSPAWVPQAFPHILFSNAESLAKGIVLRGRKDWLARLEEALDHLDDVQANRPGAVRAASELAGLLLAGCETYLEMKRSIILPTSPIPTGKKDDPPPSPKPTVQTSAAKKTTTRPKTPPSSLTWEDIPD